MANSERQVFARYAERREIEEQAARQQEREREQRAFLSQRSHATEFDCSGEHDDVSGACLPRDEDDAR